MICAVLVGVSMGCSDGPSETDAGPADAGTDASADATPEEGGTGDAGFDASSDDGGGTPDGAMDDGGGTPDGAMGDGGPDGGSPDAGPPCDDPDGDGFGDGAGCAGADCAPDDAERWNDCDDTDDCIDNDGDGYGIGDGCDDPDCDDTDPCVWVTLAGYSDADGDGFGTGDPVDLCTGGLLPGGYGPEGGDCDDDDPLAYPGAAFREAAGTCMRDADHDGWGADTAGAGVDAGGDCDDTDVLVWDGAPELPEDGVDQDCDGSDLTIDDSTAVFVDAGYASCDTGTGTQDSPVCSIGDALAIAADGQVVAVAAGDYVERVETTTSVFGGYDSAAWDRDIEANTTSLMGPPDDDTLVVPSGARVAIQGLAVQGRGHSNTPQSHGIIVAGDAAIVDCDIRAGYSSISFTNGVMVEGFATVARSHVFGEFSPNDGSRGVRLGTGAEGALVADSVVDGGDGRPSTAFSHSGGTLVVLRSSVAGGTETYDRGIDADDDAARLWLEGNDIGGTEAVRVDGPIVARIARNRIDGSVTVREGDIGLADDELIPRAVLDNNVIHGTDDNFSRALMVASGSVAFVAHNTILGGAGNTRTAAVEVSTRARAQLVNNVLRTGTSSSGDVYALKVYSVSSSDTAAVELDTNLMWGETTTGLVGPRSGEAVTSTEAVDACGWVGCVCARGTLSDDPLLEEDTAGELRPSASSPVIDRGADPAVLAFPVPRDIDGDARPLDGDGDGDAAHDVGAHELAP